MSRKQPHPLAFIEYAPRENIELTEYEVQRTRITTMDKIDTIKFRSKHPLVPEPKLMNWVSNDSLESLIECLNHDPTGLPVRVMNNCSVFWHSKYLGYYLAPAEESSPNSLLPETLLTGDNAFDLCLVNTERDSIRYYGRYRRLEVLLPLCHPDEFREMSRVEQHDIIQQTSIAFPNAPIREHLKLGKLRIRCIPFEYVSYDRDFLSAGAEINDRVVGVLLRATRAMVLLKSGEVPGPSAEVVENPETMDTGETKLSKAKQRKLEAARRRGDRVVPGGFMLGQMRAWQDGGDGPSSSRPVYHPTSKYARKHRTKADFFGVAFKKNVKKQPPNLPIPNHESLPVELANADPDGPGSPWTPMDTTPEPAESHILQQTPRHLKRRRASDSEVPANSDIDDPDFSRPFKRRAIALQPPERPLKRRRASDPELPTNEQDSDDQDSPRPSKRRALDGQYGVGFGSSLAAQDSQWEES